MKKPLILGFYGYSNSGKTTLLSSLITRLTKQGYRIAAVKKTDKDIRIDTTGKDTHRFLNAGAEPVLFFSEKETALIKNTSEPLASSIHTYLLSIPLDIIFIEGASDTHIEKIRIGNRPIRENTIYTYQDNIDELEEIIKKKYEERKLIMTDTIEIKVNGKKIPLTEFPAEIISHTIYGMIETLKGVEQPVTSISIQIEKKS